MLVFEVTYPGTLLKHLDRNWAWTVQLLLSYMEDQLTDAVVSLNLFQREQQQVADAWRPSPARQADYDAARQAIEDAVRRELGDEVFFKNYLAVEGMVEQETRRQLWQLGEMPVDYARRLPFLYAHMFVYALDSFGKILSVLVQDGRAPQTIIDENTKFKAALPQLKAVRDSAHHIEDRGRGLDKARQPLHVRALELSNLWGNRLVYTASDGQRAEVPIDEASAKIASSTLQRVIDAFTWEGRERMIPY